MLLRFTGILVSGDVIRICLDNILPADTRLLDGDPVEVDQSALTGESLPASRKSGEAVFSGSIIRQGEINFINIMKGIKKLAFVTIINYFYVRQQHKKSTFLRCL